MSHAPPAHLPLCRCYNAPQQWQLGWAKPLATLNSSNFQAGKWFKYTLPEMTLRQESFLQVSCRCVLSMHDGWASGYKC